MVFLPVPDIGDVSIVRPVFMKEKAAISTPGEDIWF
jgi:hypothetical protein